MIDDSDIYLFDLASSETTAIATTLNNETNAQVNELGDVVYELEFSSGDQDIKFYDGITGQTINLASSFYDERNPQIAGNYISWEAYDGNDYEIYRYDILTGQTSQITNNVVDDYNAQVSELGFVVFEREFSSTDNDVLLYTDSEVITLGNSFYDELNPQIEGNYVSWEAWDGNDYEIYSAEILDDGF